MAKLKSGFFASWLKSCLAKKNLAFSPLALNHLSENQESQALDLASLVRFRQVGQSTNSHLLSTDTARKALKRKNDY